jgi:predicted lipoprotein
VKPKTRRLAASVGLPILVLAAAAFLVFRERVPSRKEAILWDVAYGVILPNYRAFADRAGALRRAASAFSRAPSPEALREVQEAWKAARLAWGVCEAHLIGPEEDRLLHAKVDTSPAAPPEELLAGADPLDAASVEALGAGHKGFLAIEAWIFGEPRLLAGEDERRRQALVALCQNLEAVACEIRDAWEPSGGNFVARFTRPGREGSPYPTADAALDDLINRVVQFTEVTKDARLGRPLGVLRSGTGTPQPEAVEARRSGHSLEDLRADLEGVGQVYEKLSRDVAAASPELDESIRFALNKSKEDVAAIPSPLEEAVLKNPDHVLNAFNMIKVLRDRLAVHLVAVYRSSLRFSDFDGD